MKILCDALNVLIWKLPSPEGGMTSEEMALFIIAELADKNITGIAWDDVGQRFYEK